MTRHRRAAYGTAALIVVLAGVLWWARAAAVPGDAASRYAQALRDGNVSAHVTLDGHAYQVTNGTLSDTTLESTTERRVLALAYAQALAERHPIFDLTGVDPDALDASVDQLAKAQQDLSAAQANDANAALALTLYPIDFLRALARLERARQAFIASGSDVDEAQYLARLDEASKAGLRDVDSFNNTVALLLHPQQHTTRFLIPGLGGAITLESFYAGAQSEAARLHEAARAVQAQADCLAGATTSCEPDALALPQPEPLDIPALSPERQELVADVSAIARGDIFHNAPARTVVLAHSECLASLPGPYYFLDESKTGGPGAPLFYVGDLFFQSLASSSQPGSSFDDYLQKTYGAKYLFANPMAFYVCPEVGADYGRVRAIDALAQFAQAHPGIEPTLRAPLVGKGPLLESDAVAYLRALLARESAAPDQYLPEALRLALMYRDRAAGLETMVTEIASINSRHAAYATEGIPFDVFITSLVITHSGMQTLYLADNPTAGQSDASFRLEYPNNLTLLNQNLLRYSTMRDLRSVLVRDIHAMDTFEGGS